MYSKRNIGWGSILRYALKNLIFFPLYAIGVFCIYHFVGWTFIDVPFRPLSVIGIAMVFYIGFKNSQSYDRFWEGRKIWGGNDSSPYRLNENDLPEPVAPKDNRLY